MHENMHAQTHVATVLVPPREFPQWPRRVDTNAVTFHPTSVFFQNRANFDSAARQRRRGRVRHLSGCGRHFEQIGGCRGRSTRSRFFTVRSAVTFRRLSRALPNSLARNVGGRRRDHRLGHGSWRADKAGPSLQ